MHIIYDSCRYVHLKDEFKFTFASGKVVITVNDRNFLHDLHSARLRRGEGGGPRDDDATMAFSGNSCSYCFTVFTQAD